MNPALGIAVVLGLLGALILVAAGGRRSGRLGAEAARKLVHVGMGLICCAFPWLFVAAWPVHLLGGLALAALLVVRISARLRGGLGRALHDVERDSWGELCFPLAVMILWWLADGVRVHFLVPMLVLALADAAAAVVGSGWGRLHYDGTGGRKSWEGSLAFFMVGFLAVHVPLLLDSGVGRLESVLIGATIAFLVMLAEALSWRGLDNLFVPLLVAVLLQRFIDLPATDLAPRLLVAASLTALAWSLRGRSTVTDAATFGAALAAYAAYGLHDARWLLGPLLLWFAYPHLSPSNVANSRRVHDLSAVAAICLPALFWAVAAWALDAPSGIWAWQASWAAALATIGVAGLGHDRPQRRLVVIGLQMALLGGLVLLPVLIAIELWCGSLAMAPMLLAWAAPPLAVALFLLCQPGMRDCPQHGRRWLCQGLCILLAVLPLAILLFRGLAAGDPS